MFWIYCFVIAVIAYFGGSFNGAIVASKYIFHKDVREYGSGNAGLTNFHRVFGFKGLLLVILIDVAKTALCVWLGGELFKMCGYGVALGKIYAGFWVVMGHFYPIMYGFQGGKGVLACGVLSFMIDWRVGAVVWGVFLLTVIITRMVSLGSVLGAVTLATSVAAFGFGIKAFLLALICSGFVIARHSENIKRIVRREESKLSFKKKKK